MDTFRSMEDLIAAWRERAKDLNRRARAVQGTRAREYDGLAGRAQSYASGLQIYSRQVVDGGLSPAAFPLSIAVLLGGVESLAARVPAGDLQASLAEGMDELRRMYWEALHVTISSGEPIPAAILREVA